MSAANPLDQLKDIHLPDPIGFWPPAPGWWLVGLLLIALLVTGLFLYRRYQKHAYRRMAVQQLNSLFEQYQQPQQHHDITAQLNCLLKTVAQQTYTTEQISRLTGTQWLNFLDSSANTQTFSQGPGQILASAPYDKNAKLSDVTALKQCCIQWIRRHQ